MGNKEIKFTIVSGAPKSNVDFIKARVDRESFVIAADSGYLYCIKAGIMPKLIIGDFDSSKRPVFHCDIITLPKEKDDTDTFAAVKEACRRGAAEIEIFGAVGSRLDHTYANVMCLEYCRERNIKATILNDKNKAFISVDNAVVDNKNYKYFSVFSLAEKSILSISGAKYNLENAEISYSSSLGVSNEVSAEQAVISIKNGKILVIQSND